MEPPPQATCQQAQLQPPQKLRQAVNEQWNLPNGRGKFLTRYGGEGVQGGLCSKGTLPLPMAQSCHIMLAARQRDWRLPTA